MNSSPLQLSAPSARILSLRLSSPLRAERSLKPSSRSLNFWILPLAVLGYEEVQKICLGTFQNGSTEVNMMVLALYPIFQEIYIGR